MFIIFIIRINKQTQINILNLQQKTFQKAQECFKSMNFSFDDIFYFLFVL